MHTHAHMYARSHTQTRAHTHTHVHTYTHTHGLTCRSGATASKRNWPDRKSSTLRTFTTTCESGRRGGKDEATASSKRTQQFIPTG